MTTCTLNVEGFVPCTASRTGYAEACALNLRDRLYDMRMGQFAQSDRYEGSNSDPASLHRYVYTHGNPVNGIDPSGMFRNSLQETLEVASVVTLLATFLVMQVWGPTIVASRATAAKTEVTAIAGQFASPVTVTETVMQGDEPALRRITDARPEGSRQFVHGTTVKSWGASTAPNADGRDWADFGAGFYCFKADVAGLFASSDWAIRLSRRAAGRDTAFLIILRIGESEYNALRELRLEGEEWSRVVNGYRNDSPPPDAAPFDVVTGAVGIERGRTWFPNDELPDQYAFRAQGVAMLRPVLLVPLIT